MNLSDAIQDVLKSYRSFSLEKVEAVKLMHRVDTKYIIPADEAIHLLYNLREDYHVLEIASQRIGTYTSVYYDTSDRQMFYAHVTGRFPRYKVRERYYSQNGLKFFEIKQKTNAGRTFKRRMSITKSGSEAKDWIPQQSPFRAEELTTVLYNYFDRITLINNEQTERITLDFNLFFRTPSEEITPVFDRVAIVELKQDKSAGSPVRNYLRNKGIRPKNVSKFCIGMLLTEPKIGYKRYKPNFTQFIKNQYEPFDGTDFICHERHGAENFY